MNVSCVSIFPPSLLPTSKPKVNNIKSCCRTSQLPSQMKAPAVSLQFPSGRQRGKRGDAAFFASLSFLSNGLEMYYYANVNFDTEL